MTHEHIAAAYESIDTEIVPEILRQAKEQHGLTVPCKAGCCHCCREPVQCSKAEVEYLVANMSPELRERVTVRTRAWLVQMQASGMLKEERPNTHLYRGMRVWCPLLEEGRCSVYARRPEPCRMFHALHDPINCEDDRLRETTQRFAQSPSMIAQASCELFAGEGWVENDHLGLWLAEILLGKKIASAYRQDIRITLTPSPDKPIIEGEPPFMDATIEFR